jgi:hypothetical protein
MNDLLAAPCSICGYNGPGYWQRETHDRECPWRYIGGKSEREMAVRALSPRLKCEPAHG